jgi:toxin ParE1/3/4
MAHLISPQAESDLDEIWLHVAKSSGSMEVANRIVDSIAERFLFLAKFPFAGRMRSEDFGTGSRTFAVGEYVILYIIEGDDVAVLRVAHGRRHLERLFGK